MAHPDLKSARLKLDRAREHIERLKAEQEEWARIHPHPYDVKLVDDPQPNRILAVVGRLDDPPGFMSTMVGDIVHNLRSTLDHIAWQMVLHGATPTLTPSETKQIQFPIHDLVTDYDDNQQRRLRGVPDMQDQIVRRYQPYQLRDQAADHPFAILQQLSNTDKHPTVHLTYWCTSKATFTVTEQPLGCLIKNMVTVLDLYEPLEVGTRLYFVDVAGDRSLCRGMLTEARFTYQISFEDGTWVNNTVSHIERMVSELLAEIEGVL